SRFVIASPLALIAACASARDCLCRSRISMAARYSCWVGLGASACTTGGSGAGGSPAQEQRPRTQRIRIVRILVSPGRVILSKEHTMPCGGPRGQAIRRELPGSCPSLRVHDEVSVIL